MLTNLSATQSENRLKSNNLGEDFERFLLILSEK